MSDQTRVNMLYMFLGVSYKQMYTLRNWFNKIIIRDECLLMVAGIDYIKTCLSSPGQSGGSTKLSDTRN